MPRPKRTKVAPSIPAPRVQRPANAKLVKTASEAPKSPFNELYDASDSPERVERSARNVKNNGKGKGVARDSEQEDDGVLQQRGRSREASNHHLEDSIGIDLELLSSSPEVEVGRREQRTPAVESSVLAMGNFRRRPRQPSILGRGAARSRSSSIESNLAETNGLTSVGKKNASVLAMGSFARQQREPSIMGRNTMGVATSSTSLDIGATPNFGSAMKIGNFKRRAREPSILRTAQKRQPPALSYDNDEDEDDFEPDDESTPLNLHKTRHMATSSGASSSNPRKRKLSAIQNQRSSPSLPPQITASREEEMIPATYPENDEAENGNATSVVEESMIASIEAREDTPEQLSETMAPPLSSSPEQPSPVVPPRQNRASSRGRGRARAKTPLITYEDDSDISSPPSLTHSPDRPVASKMKSKPKPEIPPPSTFSTRQLQALLPRRRRRPARDVFEIATSEDEVDASGLGSDDDELTHINARARTRRPTNASSRTPAPVIKKVTKLKDVRKETAAVRTYGSRGNATSDKENEIDPNDSLAPLPDDDGNEGSENSQEIETRLGKELKQAAKKFAEVDKWEMEFEDLSPHDSSPKDAR